MLTRRHILQLGAAAGATPLVGCGSSSSSAPSTDPQAGFPSSTLHGSRGELDTTLEVISGEIPKDIQGHALVVTSIPYGDGTPLFTGDGMVYRLSFEGGQVRLTSRLLRTPCFAVDEAAAGTQGLEFRNSGFVRLSAAFGARNFGNTALQPIQDGRLLATYDAGRPWEIDPRTLEVITPVGLQTSWKPFLPPIVPGLSFFTLNMSSAHPAYDSNERTTYLVNFATQIDGLDTEPFVRVLWWDGTSEPKATTIVEESGEPALIHMSCHQMHVTKSFVVLLDGAFQIEAEQMTGQDVTRPQRPESVLYFIHKSDLEEGGTTRAKKVVIPSESAHFLVDYEDDGQSVTLLLAHQNSADPSEWIRESDMVAGTDRPVDPGTVTMLVAPADQGMLGRYVVNVESGEIVSSKHHHEWSLTLWSQDPRSGAGLGTGFWSSIGWDPSLLTQRILDAYRDHPHRQIPVDELPKDPIPGSLLRVDHDSLSVGDRYQLPAGHLPMSPTFVPREGGGPDEGYVLVFSIGASGDEVWLFDSSDLSAGPICRLGHRDFDIPFTLHSTWLPELRSLSTPSYYADPRDDYGPRVTELDSTASALARQVLNLD